MRYQSQTTHHFASRVVPVAAMLALVFVVSIFLIQITQAQAPASPTTDATGLLTATSTPQDCAPLWDVVSSPNVGQSDNILMAVDALAPDDVWAVGYYTGTGRELTLTQHWDGTQWNIVPSPNPGAYNNVVRGVTAIASDDVWAVGDYNYDYYHSTRHLLTMHWDGTQWNVIANPDPGGNYDNSLNAVKAWSANDVWTVGFYRYTGFDDLRMHWDGGWTVNVNPRVPYGYLYSVDGLTSDDVWAVGSDQNLYVPLTEHLVDGSWSVVAAPSPTANSPLYGVKVVSTNDVWAVGNTDNYGQPQHSITQHWDGTVWSSVDAPDVGHLSGVTATAANDVWASADGAFLHWDGSSWNIVADPVGGKMAGIDALSSTDMWSVGTQMVNGVKKTLIEHYTPTCATATPTNTSTPTLTPTATPCIHNWIAVAGQNVGSGGNILKSVAVVAPDDVWAVGYYTDTNSSSTLIQHWDGAAWSIVPSPDPDRYNVLNGVSAIAADDVWAVGYYSQEQFDLQHLLTLHWDGTQWNNVPNPDPGGNYTNYLSGVKGFASNNVWAVGFYRENQPLELILHWDGTQWHLVTSPSGTLSYLAAVDGAGPDDVWALGWTDSPPPEHGLTEHWDGSSWSVGEGGLWGTTNHIDALTVVASDDVWAVGYYDDNGTLVSMLQRWHNGYWSTYTLEHSPDRGEMFGVQHLSANDVWAVGVGDFLHWDGVQWSDVTTPISGTLYAADATTMDDMWAVGTQQVDGVNRTLIERYLADCTPVTLTPSPTRPTATPTTRTSTPTPSRTASRTSTAVNTPTAGTPAASSTMSPTANTATTTATPTGTIPTGTATITLTPDPTSTACAITFSDVPVGSTFYPYVQCLVCRGIAQGYPDGTYRPNNALSRGQAAKIIANSAGWLDPIPPEQQSFNDVPPDSTFWLYVERAYMHGAIAGYACGGQGEPCPGPYFRPGDTLTRGQIAKIVSIAAGYNDPIPPQQQTFSDVVPGSTFWLYIERVALHGVVSGYTNGTYRPENPVTRGQIAKFAANAFFPECGALDRQQRE